MFNHNCVVWLLLAIAGMINIMFLYRSIMPAKQAVEHASIPGFQAQCKIKIFPLRPQSPIFNVKELNETLRAEGYRDQLLSPVILQQAAPLLFSRTLALTPQHLAMRVDDADVILVDMSEYSAALVVSWRGHKPIDHSPIEHVMRTIHTSSLWAATQGRGFVFMAPHPLELGYFYRDGYPCSLGKNAYYLVVEPGQLCTDAQAKENSTTIPYSSVAHVQFDPAYLAEKSRATLLWHRSNCGDANAFYGMHLRTRIIAALRAHNASDVVAACSGERADRVEHRATVEEMLGARFCLVLAGDTQSSRRLTEVMLTGCIPVFVGPPWHAMPLADSVPWKTFAMFFTFGPE